MPHATEQRLDATADQADVAAVADRFVSLMHVFNRARNRFLAAAKHDVDWSAQIVLKTLAMRGPMRSSDLACAVQSDPSTVSRQIAALVKDGLVERQADPVDGRATLLARTDLADAVLADHDELRLQHFMTMLGDWNQRDLQRFASLLERFTQSFEAGNERWIDEKFADRLHAYRAQRGTN